MDCDRWGGATIRERSGGFVCRLGHFWATLSGSNPGLLAVLIACGEVCGEVCGQGKLWIAMDNSTRRSDSVGANGAGTSPLSLLEAQKVLAVFNCLEEAPSLSESQQAIIRSALRTVVHEADCVIFGVCAESIAQGLAAVRAYGAGLDREVPPEPEQRGVANPEQPIYIKCNTNSLLFYAEPYQGENRGVLVSCQSQVDEELNAMYGHLPLDLFA